MKKKNRIYALVDCNNFYASCERIFDPSLAGQPVVILSNNDGCAVALSNEAKTMGIKRGEPYFKLREKVGRKEVFVFSSNYALYGDISARVMNVLSEFAPKIEIYSIDECFLALEGISENLTEYCQTIKNKVKKWTGMPVSVGIGRTKTLAKLANHIAKKNPCYHGVFNMDQRDDVDSFLEKITIDNIWGIGRQNGIKLNNTGIYTALQLKNVPDDWIKKHMGGITGLRTIWELRGIPCIEMETVRQNKKGIVSSRSFGKPVETLDGMEEAVSSYITRAAEKIRNQQSVASTLHIFINTNRFKEFEPQYNNSISYRLPNPSAFTPELIHYGLRLLRRIYRHGYKYKKAGVMLTGIIPENEVQLNLFTATDNENKHKKLSTVLDKINDKWGRNTLQLASSGINREWKMRREMMSPRYTTSWEELPIIKI